MGSKKIIWVLLLCILLTGCKEKTFKVTFDTMGGSIIESVTIKKGELLENIDPPTKEGYLFVSWLKDGIVYDFNKPIKKDTTLIASWIETPKIHNHYTVTFVTENSIEKVTVNENETVKKLPAEEKDGYKFLGWYSGEELYNFDTPVTKNFSLMAKYELNTVTITYDLDGGIGKITETIPKNSQASIPEIPTKTGYKFLKWTCNDEEFSFDTTINEDTTLKAIWAPIEYITITFDTAGGIELSALKIEKYSKINEIPIPIKNGYTFKEWQLNNQTFNSDTILEENITLKAIYIEN